MDPRALGGLADARERDGRAPSEQSRDLACLGRSSARPRVVSQAIRRSIGQVSFRVGETNSGIVSRESADLNVIGVACTTFDRVAEEAADIRTTLLKLDPGP